MFLNIPIKGGKSIAKKIYVESSTFHSLSSELQAKVTIIRNEIEIVTSQNVMKQNALSKIKRISKNEYVKVETGEVFKYNTNANKTDNTVSIKKSLKNLRKLILNNFVEFESIFITLTYKDEMFDFVQAVQDYTKFFENLKKHYKHYNLKYLRIIEPTDKGNWHIHVLLKSAEKVDKFYISQEKVQSIWKHGSVKVEQIHNIGGLANYFCTYSNDDKALPEKAKPKHVKKQERWKYYPYRARIFAKSNDIVYPKTVKAKRGQVDELLKDYKRVSASTLTVKDSEGRVVNKVNYEHYKKR